MVQSKLPILIKAIQNVRQEQEFCNRWISQSSLLKVISGKYEFQTSISVCNISQAIKKVSPTYDDVRNINSAGIYSVKKNHNKFLFFQDVKLPPPIFPCFYKEKEEWDRITKKDEEICSSFLDE